MSTHKWATSKVYTTFSKLGQTAPYMIFVNAMFPNLTKQTILPIIQKVMPIILTLFSTKMWFLLFSIILGIICLGLMRTEHVCRFRCSSQAAAPGHSSSCAWLFLLQWLNILTKHIFLLISLCIRLTKTGEITTMYALNHAALSGYFVNEEAN